MTDLKLLIIESDPFLRDSVGGQIAALPGFAVIGAVADPAAAQRLAGQHRPDVVVLEIADEGGDAALQLAEWLRVEQPHAMVLGASTSVRPDLMRRAMRSGVHDLLARPIDPAQLKVALDHAAELAARRERSHTRRGRVTAVIGVSGGIGTTTVAVNVAAALARRPGPGPVAIVDLDLVTGSVPCFLDLHAQLSFQELVGDMERLDGERFRQLLPRHRSGLYMLPGPQTIEDLDAVTHEEVARIVELCRTAFRHAVVDGGHGIDERRLELLERVDAVLLVMQPNVASLHRARRTLSTFDRLGFPTDRIEIVLNRIARGADIGPDEVEKSLKRTLSHSIPNDYRTVVAAIDAGVPLVEGKRSNRVAVSLRAIADGMPMDDGGAALDAASASAAAPAGTGQDARGGPLRRWLGGHNAKRNGTHSSTNGVAPAPIQSAVERPAAS